MVQIALSFKRRMLNFVFHFLGKSLIEGLINSQLQALVPTDMKDYVAKSIYPNLTVFTAYEGVFPPLSLPLNVKVVNPEFKQYLSRDELKFSKE